LPEAAGGLHIPFVEARAAGEAVDEIVGDVRAREGGGERGGIEDVSTYHLNLRQPVAALQTVGVAGEDANAMARREQARHEATADVAGRTGD
jgi:hypothetical protein